MWVIRWCSSERIYILTLTSIAFETEKADKNIFFKTKKVKLHQPIQPFRAWLDRGEFWYMCRSLFTLYSHICNGWGHWTCFLRPRACLDMSYFLSFILPIPWFLKYTIVLKNFEMFGCNRNRGIKNFSIPDTVEFNYKLQACRYYRVPIYRCGLA